MKVARQYKSWDAVLEIRSGRGYKEVISPEGIYPIMGSSGKVMGFATKFICEEGTTIVGRKGTIDNPLYIDKKFWNVDTAFGLHAKDGLDKRYLYYFCRSFDFKSMDRGSGRPSLVKSDLLKIEMPIPPLPEQKAIVKMLDEAFAKIDQAKANIEKNIENAKELFRSKKEQLFEELKSVSEILPMPEICEEIFAGGDAPKQNMSKEKTEKYNVPIIANAVKDNGLYGYTTDARVLKPSITIAARGSGTGHTEIRNYPFFPIVRLIVLTPITEIVKLEFLRDAILNLVITRSGSAIPQLTIPMIKTYNLPIPDLKKQELVVVELSKLRESLYSFNQKNEIKLKSLDELKSSILQRAFSGELV